MSKDDEIVIAAICVGLVIIVLLLGLYTKCDAAEVKAMRSPVHARHVGSWVRLSNDTPSPEIIITPAFDLPEEPQEDVAETNVGNIEPDQIADDGKMVEPDPQEVEYLAIVIFCEAGADAQSDETRYMVGDVVLNRVADSRYPDTIYKVLTQKAQYGRFYWTGIIWPERASYKGNAHAVERAREIAYNLLTDTRHSDLWGKGYIYQDCRIQGKDNIWSDGICFGR